MKMRKDLLFALFGAAAVTLQVTFMVVQRSSRHMDGRPRPAAELEQIVPGLGLGGVMKQQSLAEVNEAVSLNLFEKQGSCELLGQQNAEYMDRQNCPVGQVLSHFRFTGHGCYWWGLRFQYWCRNAETSETREIDSDCQVLRGQYGEFIDRQRPVCGQDEVMTGFQLHSGGCGENHMRFRVRCAKVLTPWYLWGKKDKKEFRAKYKKWWRKYSKNKAKFKKLLYPNSPTGTRLKKRYDYAYRMYLHWRKKYKGVGYKRKAIKYERMYRRYRRYPTEAAKARDYEDKWHKYDKLYLETQGQLPEAPVETYPKDMFPKVQNYSDPNYWNVLWTDKMPRKVTKRISEPGPPAKCGDECVKNAHELFGNATERLGEFLPSDVAWEKYPKALVLDPKSQDARVSEALGTDTFDPLGNADVGIVDGFTGERHAEFDQVLRGKTGCFVGDKECLQKAGVWPASGGLGNDERLVHDKKSAYKTLAKADKRLASILPQDPDWSDYPKELVQDKKSRQARVKDALDTKVFDPLDNADIGMVPGDHARSRSQYRVDMRESTGCDLGERDCFEDFKVKNKPVKKSVPAAAGAGAAAAVASTGGAASSTGIASQ